MLYNNKKMMITSSGEEGYFPNVKEEILSQQAQLSASIKYEHPNNKFALPNPALKINGPLFFPVG
jgi:hypothetical protein